MSRRREGTQGMQMSIRQEMRIDPLLQQRQLMSQWQELDVSQSHLLGAVCSDILSQYYMILNREVRTLLQQGRKREEQMEGYLRQRMGEFANKSDTITRVRESLSNSGFIKTTIRNLNYATSGNAEEGIAEPQKINTRKLRKIHDEQIRLALQTISELTFEQANSLFGEAAFRSVADANPVVLTAAHLNRQQELYTSFLRDIGPLVIGHREEFTSVMRDEGGFIRPFDQSLPGHPSDEEQLETIYKNPYPKNDYQHLLVGLEDMERLERGLNPLLTWVHLRFPHRGATNEQYRSKVEEYLTHGISGNMTIPDTGPTDWRNYLLNASERLAFIEMICRDRDAPLAARRAFALAMELMHRCNPAIELIETYRLRYVHVIGVDIERQWQGGENHASGVFLEERLGFTEYGSDESREPYARRTFKNKTYDVTAAWKHIVAISPVVLHTAHDQWLRTGYKYEGAGFYNQRYKDLPYLMNQLPIIPKD